VDAGWEAVFVLPVNVNVCVCVCARARARARLHARTRKGVRVGHVHLDGRTGAR
jgi:hypothetical protein